MPKVAVASLRQRNIMSCDMQAKRGEAAGAEIVQLAAETPEVPTDAINSSRGNLTEADDAILRTRTKR